MTVVTWIAIMWLLACTLGAIAWGTSLRDSLRTLHAQRRNGENGILEAIAREFIIRDSIGTFIATGMGLAALVVLATEADDSWRVYLTRGVLTVTMAVFTIMGVHGRVKRVQIASAIRTLYAEAKGNNSNVVR